MRGESTKVLLAGIHQTASLPFESAHALPAGAYTSEHVFSLELQRIFAQEWVCVGHVSQVPAPGDYLATDFRNEPIAVVRNCEGRIRVLANTCAHRGARVVEGSGNARRFTCPYHAWTYDLEGELIRAPFMSGREDASSGCRLPEIRSETWHGWIYINADSNAPPLSPRLDGLDTVIAPYRNEEREHLFTLREDWPVNWKLLAENFMESYHVFVVHRRSFAAVTPTEDVKVWPGGEGYCYHTLNIVRSDEELTSYDRELPDGIRSTEVLAGIFPCHLVSVQPRYTISLTVEPLAVDALRATVSYLVDRDYLQQPGLSREVLAGDLRAGFEQFNAEDRAVIGRLWEGLHSPHYRPGPLSGLERPNWEFHRYLSGRLQE
jgi:phenylpropionate dioxygenase-like ring-hydroxylating dioxygenase large terminal subunit